ncbi:hypothetical protein P8452_04003 [Trifolium repens]|nr:hypothetical protein P8452_04003 [Trifolium repens]
MGCSSPTELQNSPTSKLRRQNGSIRAPDGRRYSNRHLRSRRTFEMQIAVKHIQGRGLTLIYEPSQELNNRVPRLSPKTHPPVFRKQAHTSNRDKHVQPKAKKLRNP